MGRIKEHKFIILIALIILGFAFYWYSYRPTQIVKLCIKVAYERAIEANGDNAQRDVRYFFWKCQKQNGLVE